MLSITSWMSSALADKVLQFSLFLFAVSFEENLLFHRRTKFRKLHHSSLTFGFVTLTDFPSLQVPFVELCRDSWRLGEVSDTYKSDQYDLHIRQQRKLVISIAVRAVEIDQVGVLRWEAAILNYLKLRSFQNHTENRRRNSKSGRCLCNICSRHILDV